MALARLESVIFKSFQKGVQTFEERGDARLCLVDILRASIEEEG